MKLILNQYKSIDDVITNVDIYIYIILVLTVRTHTEDVLTI